MRIVTTRRICQIFFCCLFIWFCIVTTLGDAWWQWRGWPVNWILELDPLIGLATLLTTGSLYAGLIWGLATVLLTLVFGRFFCGWVCPFGTMHQFIGYLGKLGHLTVEKIRKNRYHRLQVIKYWILVFLLAAASGSALNHLLWRPQRITVQVAAILVVIVVGILLLTVRNVWPVAGRRAGWLAVAVAAWFLSSLFLKDSQLFDASLQIGLLDPISLVYRSVNLILLPLLDGETIRLSARPRFYESAGLIGIIFILALSLNLKSPRFYCRFICPLGALFGLLSRYSVWRIGKKDLACADCHFCEKNCEGACQPASQIKINECVLCLNCLDECHHNLIDYQLQPSAAGETVAPDIARRQLVLSAVTGLTAAPILHLSGNLSANWNPHVIRPPGALNERAFLERCIKCGQCMRVCPTNVIHPAGLQAGLEGLWTPMLNFRIGTSGCQFKCIACGNICPTAAIRPIGLDERLGRGRYENNGPVRIGTAFVDRGRCLPWAMDRPCIVCQENCPVSPKAIITRVVQQPVADTQVLTVREADRDQIMLQQASLVPAKFATGDYFLMSVDQPDLPPRRITENTAGALILAPEPAWLPVPATGSRLQMFIRLQRPYVTPERCIGCGVCEHECPVSGKRAIRVSAENESRDRERRMMAGN